MDAAAWEIKAMKAFPFLNAFSYKAYWRMIEKDLGHEEADRLWLKCAEEFGIKN